MPEAWLRGPVEGIPAPLMPAAHCLIDAQEDIESAVSGLSTEQLWLTPGGAASIGFHLLHVPGAIDRLLTYADGESLSEAQFQAIALEREAGLGSRGLDELLAGLRQGVEMALDVYRATLPETLTDARSVGRSGLPATVQGLLFHAAEHSRRHAGQVIATAKIVKGLEL